jgi:hypothetical protein
MSKCVILANNCAKLDGAEKPSGFSSRLRRDGRSIGRVSMRDK